MLSRLLSGLLACFWVALAMTLAQAQQVQLSWNTPLQADGTPLTGPTSYWLYYGSQRGQYQTRVPVGMATEYTVTNLSPGQTYYFAIKAYNTAGMESTFSNEVSVTLPLPPPPPQPVGSLIPQQQIRVVSVDSQDTAGGNYTAANALDGNPATMWHSEWFLRTPPLPHTLVLDLGSRYLVDGLQYVPRQDGNSNGTIAGYAFYVSDDGVTWGSAAATGTLAANTSEKTVRFTAQAGRFVRLVALSEMQGHPSYTSAAELNIFGAAAPAPTPTTSLLTPSVTTSSVMSSAPASTMTMSPPTTQQTPATTSPGTSASQSSAQTASTTESSETSSAPMPTTTTSQHTRWEMTLTSTTTYANPFADVTVRVQYTKAGAPPLTGYGFWDGGSTFKVRQVFPEAGTWHYQTTATDASNNGLHNREGEVHVVPYTGTNVLYRHGLLQVSTDQRFLAHADGTPFLWVADTLWGATVWLTEAGFQEAVADRRAKHFTVLQTNFARKAEVDTAGETPWQGDRWNVHFMQKLDRMFDDANDQGMYLFVNGLVDLLWDRGIAHYERLAEMIGARYAGHYVSFGSSMDDPYDPVHAQIHAAIRRTAPRTLVAQHPGSADNGQGNVWTAEQYYDTPLVDYVMDATGVEGNLEWACRNAIEWSLRLYNRVPPKPVVNAETWYEGSAGGTAEMTAQLGYLSLLSGNVGYTYGTSLWDAKDADLPAWKAFRGATYMQYMYDFFAALDGGRPLRPRHALIQNQATRDEERMVVGVSTDGMTYAAFLPNGGTISLDLTALVGTTVGVTWYNPFTGQYRDQGTALGEAVRSFASPFGTRPSALVLIAQ